MGGGGLVGELTAMLLIVSTGVKVHLSECYAGVFCERIVLLIWILAICVPIQKRLLSFEDVCMILFCTLYFCIK